MSHFQLQYYEYTQFKNILKQLSSKEVVQRYLFDLFPFAFKDNPELYWELRNEICGHLNIHPQNFTMIGSAKLGFSLSPKKIEQDGIKVPKLGKLFNEASDIDIVIVSEQLFEKIWLKLIPYRKKVYWRMNKEAKQRFDDLQRNLFFGQLRMDKLSNDFDFAKDWWEFFNKLSRQEKYGPRQIRAAIFKSWTHANYCYERSIDSIKDLL